MKFRAATFLGLAAAAIMLALPGCHKTTTAGAAAGPTTASLKALLDFNTAETARIVASSADRPAMLDRLIVAMGQPNPNMLWTGALRTSQPFQCVTPTSTVTRCFATLSWVGDDRIAGYADVLIYDHDITIAGLLADRDQADPPQPGQTVHTITMAMYKAAADGSSSGPSSTCRQALGPNGNGLPTCFALIGPRTAVWSQLVADTPSFGSDGSPQMDLRPNVAVAAMDDMIKQLRKVAIRPDGSFSVYELGIAGPDMKFDGAGWYASNDGFITADSLYAGPYSTEQYCQANLARASTAFAEFIREVRTVDQCKYYDRAPVGQL